MRLRQIRRISDKDFRLSLARIKWRDFLMQFQRLQPHSFKTMLDGQAGLQIFRDTINFTGTDRFQHKLE